MIAAAITDDNLLLRRLRMRLHGPHLTELMDNGHAFMNAGMHMRVCDECKAESGQELDLEKGFLVTHTVSEQAVQGGAPRLRAQQHVAVWQHHTLEQLHVVLAGAVTHVHRATAHLCY